MSRDRANPEILAVGMVNLDVVVEGFRPEMGYAKDSRVSRISFRTGGDMQNCALTLARLGANVGVCAAIGDDHAGIICREEMEAAGVDCRRLRTKPGTSGICLDLLTPGGEAMFVYTPGVNAELSSADIDWAAVAGAKIVSLHSLFNCGGLDLPELFGRARAGGAVTVADAVVMTGSARVDDILPALPHLDYFVPSLIELEQITGVGDPLAGADRLLDLGVGNVLVKLGGDGCLFRNRDTTQTSPAFAVEVVDTTGAGDNFAAGFIHGLSRKLPLADTLAFANACGAIAVGEVGSNGAVRSAAQVEAFLKTHA